MTRRDAFGLAGLAGAALLPGEAGAALAPRWHRDIDNQHIAHLGDGRFLDPVMAGDHPDPAILKGST